MGGAAGAIAGAAQSIIGVAGASVQYSKLKKAVDKRQAYITPSEIYDILNATEQLSQGDTQTRNYETTQSDRAFSNALGTAETLGADPNQLSSLFDQKMNNILKIGQEFHASNMEAFGKFLVAKNLVAENKTAEWQSREDILKDLIAGISKTANTYAQTANNGFNNAITGLSAMKTSNLYNDNNTGGGGGGNNAASGGFGQGSASEGGSPGGG